MKKLNLQSLKKAAQSLLFGIISFTATAQKLPNIQKDGVLAPADIKIDGNATEWNNLFQAYNKSLHIFYTIANDNNNLYLIVQATDVHDIQKILGGGVTLTVKSAVKKNAEIAITYPRLYTKDRAPIVSKIKSQDINMDTELPGINKQLSDNAKLIEVTGVSDIPDSLISVYNEEGIKAAGLFDNKKAYTYELAFPLKYLQQIIGGEASFGYNIKLKGFSNALKAARPAGNVISIVSVRVGEPNPAAMAEMQDLNAATDFSGTYTLIKK